jgi:5S rRNA maturation endonuclease (ribonuclease M5)
MLPAEGWDVIRASQRRATLRREERVEREERKFEEFEEFLARFVRDLNHMSSEGWAVLVEGMRDRRALKLLGYSGHAVTVGELGRAGLAALTRSRKVVILTDLDEAGAVLAARWIKTLTHDGVKTSLKERKRLRQASRNIFPQIENLSRFAVSRNDTTRAP